MRYAIKFVICRKNIKIFLSLSLSLSLSLIINNKKGTDKKLIEYV